VNVRLFDGKVKQEKMFLGKYFKEIYKKPAESAKLLLSFVIV